jgi:hypothetical protein
LLWICVGVREKKKERKRKERKEEVYRLIKGKENKKVHLERKKKNIFFVCGKGELN